MLTEDDIIDINEILTLSDTQRMTSAEINYLNAVGSSVSNECDKYSIAKDIVNDRYRRGGAKDNVFSRLATLTKNAGCTYEEEKPEQVPATIMLLGGKV